RSPPSALARQPDALSGGDAGRYIDLVPPRLPGGTGERDGAAAAPVRLLDGERQLGLLVRPRYTAAGGACSEERAEQVVDVHALRCEEIGRASCRERAERSGD